MTASPVFAAVGWDTAGFEIAVAGADVAPWRGTRVGEVHEQLAALCARFGDRLTCVVESTDGMLDGGLMSAGLAVCRADPAMLPVRPLLGSVPAAELAAAAHRRPRDLTPLVLESGSLTGRFPEVGAQVDAAQDKLSSLTAARRCVRRGSATRTVALTFDDGPHPPYTQGVLDTLARYEVPATFFCVGLHASVHGDLVRRIADDGHRLGNHTWSHPLLMDLDDVQTRAQLDRTDEVLDAPGRPLFRPPYGAITPRFVDLFTAQAERTMVLWDVEPFDWARPGSDAIADGVLRDVTPGSIVLLHDGGGDRSQTVDALPRMIEGLLEQNYTLVTVDAML